MAIDIWATPGISRRMEQGEIRVAKLLLGRYGAEVTYDIRCSVCEAVFQTTQPMARYCSDDCRRAGTRAKTRERVRRHRAKT